MPSTLATIVAFLNQIGIAARAGPVDADSFLPGVRSAGGELVYDPARLRWPADLLHEAGHIAVTPPEARARLDGGLEGSEATPHGGELEAIAWSWAATLHLGIAPEELFHPDGYRGQSAGLLLSCTLGVCPGANGLAQAGMTQVGAAAAAAGVAAFPHMLRWLR